MQSMPIRRREPAASASGEEVAPGITVQRNIAKLNHVPL
jgi:hypothetical protein